MWPYPVNWKRLRFGVEIEFVGGRPREVELLPGWVMALDELQVDETGEESGSELQSPPLRWEERGQIREMLARLRAQGARANWSCGLHVHVGLEPWGEDIVLPLIDAALSCQDALRELLRTSEHRLIFCPPVTREMRAKFIADRAPSALLRRGRPQSHRTGINVAAWYDIGTVEIRYANGSLRYGEILRTVELYLRFVAHVGAGKKLPGHPLQLAEALGAPDGGYPPPTAAPRWHRERMWLEEALIPALAPLVGERVPEGEIHSIFPVPEGLSVAVEMPDGRMVKRIVRPKTDGWKWLDRP
jgi:hypothetical protein